jgi:hypothetical protein
VTGSPDDYASIFEIPIPGDLSGEEWESRLVAYERQGRSVADVLVIAEHLTFKHSQAGRAAADRRAKELHLDRQQAAQGASGWPVLMPRSITSRKGYVDAAHEDDYLTRTRSGATRLRLIDVGDRLEIWSPVNGGALINPKSAALRRYGLIASYARGAKHHLAAYLAADLTKGAQVELRREPENPYDRNAVALLSPGASAPFGYVQRGRAASVARRLEGGERLAGVSLRGPGPNDDDDSTLLLLGSHAELQLMNAARKV